MDGDVTAGNGAVDGGSQDSAYVSASLAAKVRSIEHACIERDFEKLVALATAEHGLVNDEVRRRAWPILLGCDERPQDPQGLEDWHRLPRHRDEDQVRLDVDRSFIYYPNDVSPGELDRRKVELSDLITHVLRQNPFLCYFQGYHDICQVLLLVFGSKAADSAVERISILRIRDYMLPSLSPALAHLRLLPSILDSHDPKLCKHLSQTQPFFALAATLTLYAHDIQEYGDISRLFDVLLAREAVFSIYLFAQRKEELFEIPPDEPEMLHSILCKLPKPLDLENLIAKTANLLNEHPPTTLRGWYSISSASVLKTASTSGKAARQSLGDGAAFFQRQANQLRREELRQAAFTALQKYRRPAGRISVAVVVAALAWWVRRNPNCFLSAKGEWFLNPLFRGLQKLYQGWR